jgi:nucleotide-binding universal stress UspA family protein
MPGTAAHNEDGDHDDRTATQPQAHRRFRERRTIVTIVVGVDGSAVSLQALTWAVAEGRVRDEDVRAVYAWAHAPAGSASPNDAQVAAERRLAEAVAELGDAGGVEQQAVHGHPVDVLVEQSREASLLAVGSRGHGKLGAALLGSVSRACAHHAECPVLVMRDPKGNASHSRTWDSGELIALEIAENARSWKALTRLGLREGAELSLEFVYESGGPASDRVLAEFLHTDRQYKVDVAPEGITGWTPPMPLSPSALDEWVTQMVVAGQEHGGCAFDGWTATISAPRGRRGAQAEH